MPRLADGRIDDRRYARPLDSTRGAPTPTGQNGLPRRPVRVARVLPSMKLEAMTCARRKRRNACGISASVLLRPGRTRWPNRAAYERCHVVGVNREPRGSPHGFLTTAAEI